MPYHVDGVVKGPRAMSTRSGKRKKGKISAACFSVGTRRVCNYAVDAETQHKGVAVMRDYDFLQGRYNNLEKTCFVILDQQPRLSSLWR